jgi:hypothetical protein
MTLRELTNAMKGRSKKDEDDLQWQLFQTRLMCFYTAVPHLGKSSGIKKPSDLFEIDLDKQMKKQRLKKLKPIKIVPRD